MWNDVANMLQRFSCKTISHFPVDIISVQFLHYLVWVVKHACHLPGRHIFPTFKLVTEVCIWRNLHSSVVWTNRGLPSYFVRYTIRLGMHFSLSDVHSVEFSWCFVLFSPYRDDHPTLFSLSLCSREPICLCVRTCFLVWDCLRVWFFWEWLNMGWEYGFSSKHFTSLPPLVELSWSSSVQPCLIRGGHSLLNTLETRPCSVLVVSVASSFVWILS